MLFSEDTSRAKWQFSVLERRKLELICGLRWWDTLLCWEKDGPISAGGTAVMIHWSSESTQGRSKMMPRFQSWEKLKYFSKALVCFQHWLFKWSRLAEKPCLLKYLKYGCCRLSSLLLGEEGPQEAGLTPGNLLLDSILWHWEGGTGSWPCWGWSGIHEELRKDQKERVKSEFIIFFSFSP